MKLYEAKVQLTTVCYEAVFTIPCISSAKAAIETVLKYEAVPRECLKIIELKESK